MPRTNSAVPAVLVCAKTALRFSTVAAGPRFRRRQRFIHDAANGTRAAATLRAAAEAMIDLAGGPRRAFAGGEGGADVVVGEYVAGADDHCRCGGGISTICNYP